jgi:hypothetical protein
MEKETFKMSQLNCFQTFQDSNRIPLCSGLEHDLHSILLGICDTEDREVDIRKGEQFVT